MTIEAYAGLPVRRFARLGTPARLAVALSLATLALVASLSRTWAISAGGWAIVLIASVFLAQVHATPRTKTRFAVIDLETTGLDNTTNRVIEVAIVHTDGNGSMSTPRSWLIKPDDGSFGGEEIHHISTEDLKFAPSFSEVASEILDELRGCVVVAHNASFDWGFLNSEFARVGALDSPPVHQVLCTARLAKSAGLRPLKLASVCDQLGVAGPASAHRAGDDALACARTLAPLLDRLGVADVSRL